MQICSNRTDALHKGIWRENIQAGDCFALLRVASVFSKQGLYAWRRKFNRSTTNTKLWKRGFAA